MRIPIIGEGGQGQVIADAVLLSAEAGRNTDVIGYLDDNLIIISVTTPAERRLMLK